MTGRRSKRVKRRCLAYALLLPSLSLAQPTPGQSYPARNVRMIVPFAPGGGSDLHARPLAQELGRIWNRTVVIENMGGAGGGVGASYVARAEPDGHTLLFATHPIIAINPSLYKKLAYDPDKDFAAVAKIGETPLMLVVHPSMPVRSVNELIKLAKSRPNVLNFGSGGPGTTQHLSGELFRHMASLEMVHVPFKGGALASAALMGGEIHLHFDSAFPAMMAMKAGRLRGLAVTSRNRLPVLPDMPTMSETLPGYESVLGYGILAPARTPADVVATLNRDLIRILGDAAYKTDMANRGLYLDSGTPEQFNAWLAAERRKWGELIQRLKLSLG